MPAPRVRPTRARATAGVVALATAAATATLLSPGVSQASSHREAPLTAAEPQIDNTDVYAFVPQSDPSSVSLVANWIPFEEPAGGPNFYPFSPDAYYDINIDNNGDAKADITYRWSFTSHYRSTKTILYNTGVVSSLKDANLNFYQTYSLKRITKSGTTTMLSNAIAAPSDVGDASMPDYAKLRQQALYPANGANRIAFAGQADDSFFLDLRVFDLLYGGNFKEVGHDTLTRFNVNSVALKVPKADLAAKGDVGRNPVIGVWSTTSRRATVVANSGPTSFYTGNYVQMSRLGNPLVNEAVIPVGQKNRFNATNPATDAQFASSVLNPEVPKLIQAIYGIPAPKPPRTDLAAVFLTGVNGLNAASMNKDHAKLVPGDELRLNMSIPPTPDAKASRLGVLGKDLAGFPNGRRLSDDVIDIELRALEGALLKNHPAVVDTLGDGVNTNDKPFTRWFPYLALPTSGSNTAPRG